MMKSRFLYLIAFVVIVALVAALINGFVQDSIYPIVAEFYVLMRAVVTAFQSLIWIAVVFIGVNLAIQSLLTGKKRKLKAAADKREFSGRVEALASWVRRVDEDTFYRWRIARHITSIAREAVGHSQTLTPQEMEAVLTDESIDPVVAAYIRQGLAVRSDKLDIKHFGERMQDMVERLVPRRKRHFSAEPGLIKTIEYLEAELEVQRDRH